MDNNAESIYDLNDSNIDDATFESEETGITQLSDGVRTGDNDPDGIPWYIRTIMGGLIANNNVIDARQYLEGGTINPDFGKPHGYTPSSGYVAISNYVPLMGCDKVRMRVQLTSTNSYIYGIAGVVGYDDNLNPIAVFHTVSQSSQATFGEIEFNRPQNVEYIRYHTSGGGNFLFNHIQLLYSFVTLREQLLNGTLLVRKKIALSEANGDLGEKPVYVSTGGYGSSNLHHAKMYVRGGEYITIRGRIVHDGSSYVSYGGVVLGKLKSDGTRTFLMEIYRICNVKTTTEIGYTFSVTFKLPEGADQIRWTIHNSVTLTNVYVYSEIGDSVDDYTIGHQEKKFQYLERMRQARYIYIPDNDNGNTPKVLGLLHYTDFHEDAIAGRLLNEYADTYSSLIDDVVNTGDVVKNYLDNGKPLTYFVVDGLASRSLFVLGNHDQALETQRAVYYWTNGGGIFDTIPQTVANSHEFSFQRYFQNYHQSWCVTMPTGYNDPNSLYYQACYWHKDYVAQKVRVIGVDCMYRFDGILAKDGNGNFVVGNDGMLSIANGGQGMAKLTTEQETWLKGLLDETLDANSDVYGYSVVCFAHYPLEDIPEWNKLDDNGCNNRIEDDVPVGGRVLNRRTNDLVVFEQRLTDEPLVLENQFNMRNREYSNQSPGYIKGTVNNMGDIIQHFIDHNGNFVAWICGHTHRDHFYYPTKYPHLLVVSIDQAGGLRPHDQASRPEDLDMRLCANYYAIDTANGYIKIVRLGLTYDRFLRPKRTLCFDYINRKVISED